MTAWQRHERIGECDLYLGDCLEVMPELERFDACITDPPYGVGLTGKVTKHTNARGKIKTYSDDQSIINDVVLPAIDMALALCDCALIFPGIRQMFAYPKPADIGGIVCPNGAGRSPWGFGCYNPVLFYGKSPLKGAQPTTKVIYHPGMHVTGENNISHPCPKPIAFMKWAVNRASMVNQSALDPFMGSGTTGVACVQLGRRFTGIELDPEYFDIACRRIEAAVAEPRLALDEPPPKPTQPSFLEDDQ